MFNLITDLVEEIAEDELTEELIDLGKDLLEAQTPLDPEAGESAAKNKARNKIWELEGYLLKEKLFNQQK